MQERSFLAFDNSTQTNSTHTNSTKINTTHISSTQPSPVSWFTSGRLCYRFLSIERMCTSMGGLRTNVPFHPQRELAELERE